MMTLYDAKRTCNFTCDVTNAAMTEIKILSKMAAPSLPAICDVIVT